MTTETKVIENVKSEILRVSQCIQWDASELKNLANASALSELSEIATNLQDELGTLKILINILNK